MKITVCIATIKERYQSLLQTIESLYDQVDEINLFLNDFEITTKDPKIIIHSKYSDYGDLSKFLLSGNENTDYLFTCDDDIIYPINYVETLTKTLDENPTSIVGVHGVLLKQPINSYYDMKSRYTFNFQNALNKNTFVHILGTGTIAYKPNNIQLSFKDFQYKNSADIWLAIFAQKNNIPMIAVARPNMWLKEISNNTSIWKSSYNNETSNFNTKNIQDHILQTYYPMTIQTNKIAFCIKTWNRKKYLQTCLETFMKTHSSDFQYVVIIADDGSQDGTLEYIESLKIPYELHVLKNNGKYASGQTNTIFNLLKTIKFKYAFIVDDDVIFNKTGWDKLYVNGMTQYQHLCYYNKQYYSRIRKRSVPDYKIQVVENKLLDTILDVHTCMGSLFTITPEILEKVGYTDEENFPIRGQWHVDYSIRCCRAGFNEIDNFYDVKNSEDYIDIQENTDTYKCSLDWNDNYKKTKDPVEMQRRLAVINSSRIYIPQKKTYISKSKTINDIFDHVYVLNLPHRVDRKNRLIKQLNKFKIHVEFVPAILGKNEQDFFKYEKTLLLQSSIKSSKEFYTTDIRNWPDRIGFIEQQTQRKAVCAGAYGYLKTYINILQDAIQKDYNRILVLDDDVLFHNQFHSLQIDKLPEWDIWHLGTLQYNWDDIIINDAYYYSNKMNCASHALGLHRKTFPLLLNYAMKMDLPFDIGALWVAQQTFVSVISYPNLIIQDSMNSDINSSSKLNNELNKKNNIYRWDLSDYRLNQ